MLLKRLSKLAVKHQKQIYKIAIITFAILNLLAYLGAYTMTHLHRTGEFEIGLSRPIDNKLPSDIGLEYITKRIPIGRDEWLETWLIPAPNSKGTILLFPGNLASKSKQLLTLAQMFYHLNYNSLLVDFRGIGGSSGNTTTLGIQESRDVATAMQYIHQTQSQRPIILYGVSMGSAAILTAIAQEQITPDAIVLELPYARLIDAVRSRIKNTHLPTFPMTELLLFWGGIQHGFNGFAHNPVDYARHVKCPTLILHGKQDKWTSLAEINEIFANIHSQKQLITFDRAGHNLLVSIDRNLWQESIEQFLNTIAVKPVADSWVK
jgi:uncharacterized protein